MKIGVISDTHGLLRPEVLPALKGVLQQVGTLLAGEVVGVHGIRRGRPIPWYTTPAAGGQRGVSVRNWAR